MNLRILLSSYFSIRAGGMYISTAITYQTHIEAGQGRGRSLDNGDCDDDDLNDDDDQLILRWGVMVVVVAMMGMMIVMVVLVFVIISMMKIL